MNIGLLVIAVLALAASGCATPREANPYLASGGHTGEPLRATKPMFKGVELYSWLDPATKNWHFVFLPGTNRIKTTAEILGRQKSIGSVAELKEHLSYLAPGESVFWLVPDTRIFAMPSTAVLNDIVKHAAASGVNIHLVGTR